MPRKTAAAKNSPRKQLVFNPNLRVLTNDEIIISLSKKMSILLIRLAATPQKVVKYQELHDVLYASKKPVGSSKAALSLTLTKLRQKLRENNFPKLIETVWGEGLYLTEPVIIRGEAQL